MNQNELAGLLGISPAAVTKLKKRGMPTDSLARAERWRRRHLEPGRAKGQRIDTIGAPGADPVAVARHWVEAALRDFAANRDGLDQALEVVACTVPDRWDEVGLPRNLAALIFAEEEEKVMARIEAMRLAEAAGPEPAGAES